jgi:hypothetical protein
VFPVEKLHELFGSQISIFVHSFEVGRPPRFIKDVVLGNFLQVLAIDLHSVKQFLSFVHFLLIHCDILCRII